MQIKQTSTINFGIRPQVNVSKKNQKLFNEVADKFDELNKKLDKKVDKTIREQTGYHIVEVEKNIFDFVQSGFPEHVVTFKNLTKKPAEKIAQIFAKTAEIFSIDDRLFNKSLNFIKKLKVDNKQGLEDDFCELYGNHILPQINKNFKNDEIFKNVIKKIYE